ncbi:MAG TPA: two-component regulator propeller domain-containing protein, partial [Pyrinomonadaceae bacterium]|nr:two-component regulator propeller domain-containing protein [Pyrinomonadaceae bacterium]
MRRSSKPPNPRATPVRAWFWFSGLMIVVAFLLIAYNGSPVVSSQDAPPQPQASPSPSPAPSPSPLPSPAPTPLTGLHQWGAISLFHGLPSDRVRAITQGPDGMMWFGTEAGLARFDGRRTQTINDPQMPTGRVLSLLTDSSGTLWVGTDNGAARIVYGQVQAVKDVQGQTINAIIEPENGRVLMATEQGLVYEARITNNDVQVKALLPAPLESADRDNPGPLPLTSLTVAHDKLFAGSMSRGLLVVEDNSAKEMQARRPAFFVRALATDARGQLWIGTKNRKDQAALHLDDATSELAEADKVTGTVTALRPGHADDMWVGTDGRGVIYFPSSRKSIRYTFDGTEGGLRSDHIFAIYVDREDVVWFGTDRGVSRYDPNAPRVENVGDNAESNFVRALYQTSTGQTLAGTNRGLFVYDEKNLKWNPVAELARNIIYCLAEDPEGRLLVGSAAGFYVGPKLSRDLKLETQSFTRLEASSGAADAVGSIRAITQFRGATYLASYGRGLERFDNNRVVTVWPADNTSPREIISLFAGDDSRLLLGTAKDGVLVFDGQQVNGASGFEKLKETTVRSITQTGEQTLWVATNRGVFLCRPKEECVAAAAGYEARYLAPAANEKGSMVWCATTASGLLKIVIDDKLNLPLVSQLDAEQGLPSQNAFAVLPQTKADGRSTILIGTSRGIARFTPDNFIPTLYAARVISKRVHAPNELQSGLYLEYPQNSLLLDVAAVSSRTFPEQFQYSFTLANSKGEVIKQKASHESQFAMESLGPGKYRVTARAFSRDLVPSEPLTFELTIAKAPFPWTSTALAILLLLALLALFWAIEERRRIARTSAELVTANRELAEARLNLANEAERERRRIARDLHDQTLADLRHLLVLTDQPVEAHRAVTKTNELRTEIESISHEVRRICEDLSPSVLQNVGFAAALEFALSHAVQDAPPQHKFEYEFVCDESLEENAQLSPNVQMQIYRI